MDSFLVLQDQVSVGRRPRCLRAAGVVMKHKPVSARLVSRGRSGRC